jgi:hypothetical protein
VYGDHNYAVQAARHVGCLVYTDVERCAAPRTSQTILDDGLICDEMPSTTNNMANKDYVGACYAMEDFIYDNVQVYLCGF